MKLQTPTDNFISKIDKCYSLQQGNELNETLLKLFQQFSDDKNKFNVLIKVAALNKIYATAIMNINPVAEKIIEVSKQNLKFKNINDYINLVDKISLIKWTNTKKNVFKRNNLSFASKYVHFLSGYKTPIYDSHVWILIKGYLAQKNSEKISFQNPKSFSDFYTNFERFKKEFNLKKYSNYEIDKFLWQYGGTLLKNIERELSVDRGKAKSELKSRISAR